MRDKHEGNGTGKPNDRDKGNGVEAAINAAAGTTLVLYGDVPLVQPETMARLIRARAAGMAVLTQTLDDPAGYGRIVRDEAGAVQRIVEHKDAAPEEPAIREVNKIGRAQVCTPVTNAHIVCRPLIAKTQQ